MTALANTSRASADVALHTGLSRFVADTKDILVSLGRAIEFTRRCEAEFSRTGRISPQTLDTLSKQA